MKIAMKGILLGITLLVTITTCISRPAYAKKQDPQLASSRYMAWMLGSKLSLAALLYDQNAPASTIVNLMLAMQPASEEFEVAIPPLPEKTNVRAKDSAAILNYILETVGKGIGAKIAARSPTLLDLFELSLKSNLLLLIYSPGDSTTKSLAKVITDRGTRAELPANYWQPLVTLIKDGADYEQVKLRVVSMHEEISRFLYRAIEAG